MNNTRIVKRYRIKKKIKEEIKKLLITAILILLTLIGVKKHPDLKEQIKEKVFMESIISLKIKKLYQDYFVNKNKTTSLKPVNKENIPYQRIVEENNEVKLYFSSNYPTPVLENGVLVYIDEEKAVIEQIDGVRVTYTNLTIENHKLYDYLEKGDILGETKSKELILAFQKEGEPVDYQNYI